MKREDVLRIIKEERKKNSDFINAITYAAIRITKQIAGNKLFAHISTERRNLLLGTLENEPWIVRALMWADEDPETEFNIIIDLKTLQKTYKTIEKGFLFILDNYEDTTPYFKERWPRDVLIKEAATISVEYEMAREEMPRSVDGIPLSKERAEELVRDMRAIEVGIISAALYLPFALEVSSALKIVLKYIDNPADS